MRRCLSAAPLLAALFLTSGGARAADAPYAGTWKVVAMPPGQEVALFLIKVQEKASGPKVELVSALENFKEAKLQAEKAEGGALRFTADAPGATFRFAAYPPKGDKAPKKMLGSVEVRGSRFFARLERTEDKEIDPARAGKPMPGMQDYVKAVRTRDAKEKAAALKEVAEKQAGSPLAYLAAVELTGVLPATGAGEGDVKAAAEKALAIAADYGPEMKAEAVAQVAQRLVASKKAPALAVAYARQAEKALPAGAPAAEQVAVLKTLESALRQADKKDEAKEVGERVAKAEKVLDDEYLKNAVPFKVEPFARAGSKGRVVLVELFTGAQCPPCVAADVAFDAALKSYRPGDVVLLQYHLHIPGPDPLTNADTEKRSEYYALQGVPSTYVAGGDDLGLGGPKAAGKDSFARLASTVKGKLDGDAPAKIDLAAKQEGDDVVITAAVSDLKGAGEDTRLRLALVEEVVRYPGSNGQRFHHHVVRAMPGGAGGFALKGATAKQEVKVNLADLRKALADYLEKANERRPFPNDERPLGLKRLRVVAFIQNDKTKEVLQAAQADVHAEK
jgi:hypothetical protein